MHTDKAIAEFEAAFVAGMVEEFGEGYRSSAEYMLTDGSVIAKYAKWAWFASRAELVIDLPQPMKAPSYASYEGGWNDMRGEAIDAIEAAGVTVMG